MHMTEAEKQAFLAFAGTMHGLAKQTDQMVMSNSGNINPISVGIEKQFGEVLRSATRERADDQPYISAELATSPISNIPDSTVYEEVSTPIVHMAEVQPVVVSDKVLEVLQSISLNLANIAATLETYNGSKRTKDTKAF